MNALAFDASLGYSLPLRFPLSAPGSDCRDGDGVLFLLLTPDEQAEV